MATTTKEPYLLNIDEEASKRLNLQHDILHKILDGKFIPEAIAEHLESRQDTERQYSYDWPACKEVKYLKIADLATGTGIWLYSVRKELKELDLKAELHGYDLYDNQFPPKDKREDVEFHTLNILDTPKFEEIGPKYDYIHARLLTSVLTQEEWKQAIDNCLLILRHGGYLHFEEIPFGELTMEKDGAPVGGGLLEKLQASMKLLKRDLDCGNNIAKYLHELEMLDVQHHKIDLHDCDKEAQKMQNTNSRLGLEEFIKNAIARGPEALKRLGYENEEAALVRIEDLKKSEGQTQAYFVLHNIIARKPGGSIVLTLSRRVVGTKLEGEEEEEEDESEDESEEEDSDEDESGDEPQDETKKTQTPKFNFITPRGGHMRFQVSYTEGKADEALPDLDSKDK